jgi:hypothetical protein
MVHRIFTFLLILTAVVLYNIDCARDYHTSDDYPGKKIPPGVGRVLKMEKRK